MLGTRGCRSAEPSEVKEGPEVAARARRPLIVKATAASTTRPPRMPVDTPTLAPTEDEALWGLGLGLPPATGVGCPV